MTGSQEERLLSLFSRSVDALERIADALAPKDAPPQAPLGGCPLCYAPEDRQVIASNLGEELRKKCLNCQEEYAG